MTTREELSEAALRRFDAAHRAQQSEAAMIKAHAEFAKTRDAFKRATHEKNEAIRQHAAMEQELLTQEIERK